MDNIMNDPYIKSLKAAIPGAKDATNLKELVESIAGQRTDFNKLYEESGVLDAMRGSAGGATPQEKEAITSQKRQELALAARRQGGSQGRLAGKSRQAGVAASQLQSTIDQAQVMAQFADEQQKKKEEGEQALADTMLAIAEKQKNEDDRYRSLVSDLSMNFSQLGSIQR